MSPIFYPMCQIILFKNSINVSRIFQKILIHAHTFTKQHPQSFNEQEFHEMPSSSKMDSQVLCLHLPKVCPLHVIFYLNAVLSTTHIDRGGYQKGPFCIIFKLGLKEFLERCIAQFHVCTWSITQFHNIYNCLDQVQHEHNFSSIPHECLIKSFACKICISCQINSTSQFFIKTLTYSFLCILALRCDHNQMSQ